MRSDDLVTSLLATFRDSAASDILADVGEFGVDELISGPAREIPIVSWFLGIWRTGAQVRDVLFIRKLRRFLQELDTINPNDRARFADDLGRDQKLGARVGENLLLMLDRLDDTEKSQLLARAFRLFVLGEIEYDQFMEFALAIDRCLIVDLDCLKTDDSELLIPSSSANRLSSCGLVEQLGPASIDEIDGGVRYRMSALGRLFCALVFEEGAT